MVEHVEHDVLDHTAGEVGIDEPDQRHVGQSRIADQGVDAGADRYDQLEIRQLPQQPGRRLPHQRGVDAGDIAEIGRHANVEFRIEGKNLSRKLLRPRAAGNQKCHMVPDPPGLTP
jgi:hypothetical protein